MNEDAQLLRRYAEENSEAAFGELVRRQVNFVYAAALRRVGGDTHLAEDVTQQVFTALARNARGLAGHPVLSGWLFTATRNVAAQAVRTAQRRRTREQEASVMHELTPTGEPTPEWERLRPELDGALDQLGDDDRQAVLLRFFEGRSLAEVGASLALTENAARMRVDRALDKMRATLAGRGLNSTAAALAAVLATQTGLAAPPGLATTVTGAALAGAASAGALAGYTFMSITKVWWGVTAALVAAGVGGLVMQQRTNAGLREQMAALGRENQEIARLRSENARLLAVTAVPAPMVSAPAPAPPSPAVPAPDEAPKPRPKPALASGLVPISQLGHTDRATPRSALATQLWAAANGDVDLEASAITFNPDGRARLEALLAGLPEAMRAEHGTPEKLMAFVLSGSPHPVGGMQVLGETESGPGDVRLQMSWQHADDAIVHQSEVELRQDDGGWKMVVPMILIDRAAIYLTRTAGPPPTK